MIFIAVKYILLTIALLFLSGCPEDSVVAKEKPPVDDKSGEPGGGAGTDSVDNTAEVVEIDEGTGGHAETSPSDNPAPIGEEMMATVCWANSLDGFYDDEYIEFGRIGLGADGAGVIAATSQYPHLVDFSSDGKFGVAREYADMYADEALVTSDNSVILAGQSLLNPGGRESYIVRKHTGDTIDWTIVLPGRLEAEYENGSFSMSSWLTTAVTLTKTDGILVASGFKGQLSLSQGEGSSITLGTLDDETPKIFFAEYTSDGVLAWATEADLSLAVKSVAIHEETGDIFVLGSDPRHELPPSISVVTARFDAMGTLIWKNHTYTPSLLDEEYVDFTSGADDGRLHLLADGSFYIVGSYYDQIGFSDRFGNVQSILGPIEYTADGAPMTSFKSYYRAYYDTEGTLMWGRSTYNDLVESQGEVDHTIYDSSWGRSSAIVNGDQLIVAGNAEGAVPYFAGTPDEIVLAYRPFIAAYGTDGEMDWIKTFEGFLRPNGLTVTQDNALLLTGTFTNPLTLTTTAGESQTLIPADGQVGFLLAKICD